MKKMTEHDSKSLDIVSENLATLKTIFPDAFMEDGIDFEVLRQLLGDEVADVEEKYGLNWFGKKRARQIALTPSLGTLRPCKDESLDWDTTQNLFIEGDNLEILKLLQKSYANKVKMIYIDPPYNTGKEFIYPDKFQDNLDTYLRYTGQKDDEGFKTSSNTESSGRYHTNWLNMMYPRLKLAKKLLQSDGVIFISIDDNEICNLRKLCDEIFTEECFVGQVTVLCNPKGRSQDKYLATSHEYLLVYSKTVLEKGSLDVLKSKEEIEEDYPFSNNKGVYRELELRNTHREFGKHNRPNLYYPFYVTNDGSVHLEKVQDAIEVLPDWNDGFAGCWTWGQEKASKEIEDLVGKKVNENWKVYRKAYASEKGKKPTKQLKTIWAEKRHHTEKGQAVFNKLFNSKAKLFQSPKSMDVISDAIAMTQDPNAIIMDFFSGSCTTAHTVISQNLKDNGKRNYIMAQLPEPTDEKSEAYKAGYKTIADIGKERIRRAACKIKEENPMFSGDVGFKVFKLDSSNIRVWNPDRYDLEQTLLDHMEHLVEGRSEEDVLYELLLKRGVKLTVPIEEQTIAGKTVYSIGYGVLFVCLNTSIGDNEVEDLAMGIIQWHKLLKPASDTQVVFRDSAFADNIAKSNVTAILEQNGITHVRSL